MKIIKFIAGVVIALIVITAILLSAYITQKFMVRYPEDGDLIGFFMVIPIYALAWILIYIIYEIFIKKGDKK